jgi:hypothetical protein
VNTIPNPDDWRDVITIVIVTLIVAGPTWLAVRTKRQIHDVHQQVRVVKEQVVNGHTTPMRADMDEMRLAVSNLRDEVRGGFSSLRADLTEERSVRRDGDIQLRAELQGIHDKDMTRRFGPSHEAG